MKVHLANSNAWGDGNEYIMGTASEVHTNALFDIFPNDTTITAEFKGNTQQNGTPSPSAPVPVVGVGYLDGTAYKIPVEIGLSTQSIDLSAVLTTRKIKKMVLTGNENWEYYPVGSNGYFRYMFSLTRIAITDIGISTHYKRVNITSSTVGNDIFTINAPGSDGNGVCISPLTIMTVDEFKVYLQQQYAANTPVTVYYVLIAPVTDVVNEPLQKIGDYADTISNISLTTTAGAQSFGVDTAVKPSEITLNFKGWHPKDPKESTGGEWS